MRNSTRQKRKEMLLSTKRERRKKRSALRKVAWKGKERRFTALEYWGRMPIVRCMMTK